MQELQIFNSPEFGQIRTIDRGGEPWFVGKDVWKMCEVYAVCDLLNISPLDICEYFPREGRR